ncbi:MAG TPA: hypothetical protein VN408_18705 [Actinoplanes sp.]|nr:hypothetical protein [Actinoplanes sp.]
MEGLTAAVRKVVTACDTEGRWSVRPDGDGMTITVPAGVPTGQILEDFPPAVSREILRFNYGRDQENRLRIRMAVTRGEVGMSEGLPSGGFAVTEAARIRDNEPLRQAMTAAPATVVGLVLPDEIYRRVVAEGDPALLATDYRKVVAETKTYTAEVWIRLIGPAQPGPGAAAATRPREQRAETSFTDIKIEKNRGAVAFGPGASATQSGPQS